MTQNIITVEEIQQGDKIAVHTVTGSDRTVTYTGVAHEKDGLHNGNNVWRTKSRLNLYAHEKGAVIELLDRPKPKIVLPTGIGATITYNKRNGGWQAERVATLDGSGNWASFYPNGEWRDKRSAASLIEWFEHGDAADLKVVFEGVAK